MEFLLLFLRRYFAGVQDKKVLVSRKLENQVAAVFPDPTDRPRVSEDRNKNKKNKEVET